jgi:hypothetical protein
VREFYTAALTAGGRPNGAPATRCDEDGHFNAAVLDLDGNSIEVVFKNGPDYRDDGTVIEHSRVIKWQRSVHESYESYRDDMSAISSRYSTSKPAPTEIAKAASVVSKAPTAVSKAASIARSISGPVAVPQTTAASGSGNAGAKTLIGTLLGAAAGAAVAYAMVRSEQDSAKKESEFIAFKDAKSIVKGAAGYLAQASSLSKQPMQDPQPAIETAPPTPESVHRNIDNQSYPSSTASQPRNAGTTPRQIEAAPVYYSASQVSTASQLRNLDNGPRCIEAAPTYYSASQLDSTRAPAPLALEYAPSRSVAPSQARSRYAPSRSMTSPELLTIEKARSTASTAKQPSLAPLSKAQSVAHSTAPSSLISSFVPDHVPRRVSEGSVHSHHSSRSKAKSSHTDASRHTSKSRHSRSHHSEVPESSPSPPPASKAPSKAPSKAASFVSSILGRDNKSSVSSSDFIDDLEIEELLEDDMDTVVPSDSISQIGSSHSRRTHRSHKSKKHSDSSSIISKESSASKHSHRSRSHKSRSHDDSDDDPVAQHSAENKPRRRHRPSIVSEPSDASTVRPIKASSRKDSVTHGQYDGLFDEVKYGEGSVAVRGITPSMISAAGKNKTRTVVRHDMAQKSMLFEGRS